ncbi:hypothetical protein FBEOM_12248 [Fusarium beomiforme]|uniref:Uncharacterized protein n=1 Tax=Fusarium beomiforme TaxID=44412 RepID=A0A9P5DQS5_9HYPO|nr:hypothetical protein FBEOM_12248 [Fusarium beomiforme]
MFLQLLSAECADKGTVDGDVERLKSMGTIEVRVLKAKFVEKVLQEAKAKADQPPMAAEKALFLSGQWKAHRTRGVQGTTVQLRLRTIPTQVSFISLSYVPNEPLPQDDYKVTELPNGKVEIDLA